jgi:hypothetical protein
MHLLIDLDCIEVNHGGRLTAMGGMGPLVVVEGDKASDTCSGLCLCFPSVQIDSFVL